MIPGSKAPKAFRACTKGFELETHKNYSNGAIRGYQLGTVMILIFMAVRFCFNTFWYLLFHFFSNILFVL